MTPFGKYLETLRRSRGLKQQQLASDIGVNACYISSMERGHKGPPSPNIINKIIHTLGLSSSETKHLKTQASFSKKSLSIPKEATTHEYYLVHELWSKLGTLSDKQIDIISLTLDIGKQTEKET